MRLAVFLLLATGCASSDPSWDLFAPAEPPAPSAAPAAEPAPEEFKISSEELQKNAADARAGQEPAPSPFGGTMSPVEPAPEAPAAAPAPEATPAPTETPAPAAPAQAAAPLPSPSPWPVRLVKTLPEAQPPRAILALPDGSEVVVSPGALLAEQGLVVMGIGKGSLDLAQVKPAGDHAEIAPLTLTAQY